MSSKLRGMRREIKWKRDPWKIFRLTVDRNWFDKVWSPIAKAAGKKPEEFAAEVLAEVSVNLMKQMEEQQKKEEKPLIQIADMTVLAKIKKQEEEKRGIHPKDR